MPAAGIGWLWVSYVVKTSSPRIAREREVRSNIVALAIGRSFQSGALAFVAGLCYQVRLHSA